MIITYEQHNYINIFACITNDEQHILLTDMI